MVEVVIVKCSMRNCICTSMIEHMKDRRGKLLDKNSLGLVRVKFVSGSELTFWPRHVQYNYNYLKFYRR